MNFETNLIILVGIYAVFGKIFENFYVNTLRKKVFGIYIL